MLGNLIEKNDAQATTGCPARLSPAVHHHASPAGCPFSCHCNYIASSWQASPTQTQDVLSSYSSQNFGSASGLHLRRSALRSRVTLSNNAPKDTPGGTTRLPFHRIYKPISSRPVIQTKNDAQNKQGEIGSHMTSAVSHSSASGVTTTKSPIPRWLCSLQQDTTSTIRRAQQMQRLH